MANISSTVPAIQRFFSHEEDDEDAREREVYKYYRPLEESYSNLSAESPRDPKKHLPSPDRALTAFAQLGALRLNCRRVLISLLDRSYQYVIAEATKTLSLAQNRVDDENDRLSFGVNQYARVGSACCEYTAGLVPLFPGGDDVLASNEVLVVPDLASDGRFKGEPYVLDHPHGRFYIGAPIISPANQAIGAYCVLDDEPRQGASQAEIEFVRDMAATVMAHLEMVRMKTELSRSRYMVAGLGSFIAGRSNTLHWWDIPDKASDIVSNPSGSRGDPPTTPNTEVSPATPATSHTGVPPPLLATPNTEALPPAGSVHSSGSVTPQISVTAPEPSPGGTRNSASKTTSKSNPPSRPTTPWAFDHSVNLAQVPLPSHVGNIFKRASTIIREAVELDGAIFLDAAVTEYGGLVSERPESEASSIPSSVDPSLSTSGRLSKAEDQELQQSEPCAVLGSSLVCEDGSDVASIDAAKPVPQRFLRALLNNYPKGKIWNFNRDDIHPTGIDDVEELISMGLGERFNRRGRRWRDRKLIQLLFPGVRSIAFIGMWDSSRDRWFAGSMLWTCSPTRILSAEVELNYLIAFGHSIMSGIAASEIRQADNAKGAFITSISHELRTPLHGILGSADCLLTTSMDGLQSSLVHTIETCGKTLLDTFDNLLSFTKINYLGSTKNKKSISKKSENLKTGALGRNNDIALGTLVEEVVETVFTGQEYIRTGGDQPVESDIGGLVTNVVTDSSSSGQFNGAPGLEAMNVSVTYPHPGSPRWNVQTQAGAWRRIVLNLVGNALKYTERGFVKIQLDLSSNSMQESGTPDADDVEVVLQVSDTGRGMSKEFAREKLFAPFIQEDSLSPGTGLGMSIVKNLVEAMNGQIFVSSKKNKGTAFKVVVRLPRGGSVTKTAVAEIVTLKCHGLRIGILRGDHVGGWNDATWTFVEQCRQCYGIAAEEETGTLSRDVYVTSEKYMRSHLGTLPARFQRVDQSSRRALIVICKDSASARVFRRLGIASNYFSMVCCISQPIGPMKIARTLDPIMDHLHSSSGAAGSDQAASNSMRIFPAPNDRKDSAIEREPNVTEPTRRSSFHGDNPTGSHFFQRTLDTTIESVMESDTTTPPIHHNRSFSEPHSVRPALPTGSAMTNPNFESGEVSTPSDVLPQSAPLQESAPRPTVLLVDDNAVNLRLLSTFMKKQKRVYSLAEDGLQAVEKYKEAVPSVVLESPSLSRDFVAYDHVFMDLNMPVLDGLEATRRIRGFERKLRLRPAKIVALTGMGGEEAQKEAFASGIDMYLMKPVRLKEITQILEKDAKRDGSGESAEKSSEKGAEKAGKGKKPGAEIGSGAECE